MWIYIATLKEFVLSKFWLLGRGRSLRWIFEKSAPVNLGQLFLEAIICADINKNWKGSYLNRKKSYEDVQPFYEILKPRWLLCDTLLFNYVFNYA